MRLTTAGALIGLVAVAVGSVGPWVTSVAGSAAGTRGDGKITLVAAAVAALAIAIGRGRRSALIVAAIAALVALATAGYDAVHIEYEASKLTLFGDRVAATGWGVYVALIGAGGTLIALAGNVPGWRRYTADTLVIGGCAAAIIAGAIYESKTPTARAATSNQTTQGTSVPNQTTSGPTQTTSSSATAIGNIGCPQGDTQIGYGCVYHGGDPSANPSGQVNPTNCPAGMSPSQGGCAQQTGTSGATSASGSSPSGSYSGVATTSSIGPATGQSTCPGLSDATVGQNTSCAFATNVLNIVQHAHQSTGNYPGQVTASSPTTGQTYQLTCTGTTPGANGAPTELECSTGTGAEVTITLGQ